MNQATSELKDYAESVNWNRALLQSEVKSRVIQGDKQTNVVWELIEPFILSGPADKSGAILMIPRNPAIFNHYGFLVVNPVEKYAHWQLPNNLTNFDTFQVEALVAHGKAAP